MTFTVHSLLPVSSPRDLDAAIPSLMIRTISARLSPLTTKNRHGCRFLPDGAWVAASRMACSFSSSMDRILEFPDAAPRGDGFKSVHDLTFSMA